MNFTRNKVKITHEIENDLKLENYKIIFQLNPTLHIFPHFLKSIFKIKLNHFNSFYMFILFFYMIKVGDYGLNYLHLHKNNKLCFIEHFKFRFILNGENNLRRF